eukprot:11225477-Lingulodinium_polyedra.AAC.1
MKRVRDWPREKSLAVFKEYQENPDTPRDEGGPREFPLRLEFPGWLTVSDFTRRGAEHVEEKALVESSRQQKASVLGESRQAM